MDDVVGQRARNTSCKLKGQRAEDIKMFVLIAIESN